MSSLASINTDEGITVQSDDNNDQSSSSKEETDKKVEKIKEKHLVKVITKVDDDDDESQDAGYSSTLDGPYELRQLISNVTLTNSEFPESINSSITCIEAWDVNIYIGTSAGELIHMYKIDDKMGYVQVSRQRFNNNKVKPIRKILVLPEISKVLVLCGRTVSGYLLPELSPASIGKIKDVADISVDYSDLKLDSRSENYITELNKINGNAFVDVTLFTSKCIRLIRVFDDSLRLYKDINYIESVAGLRWNNCGIVATNNQYELVDIRHSQKLQLFPSSTADHDSGSNEIPNPIISPVGGNEFLLVCSGSNKNQPSVGITINDSGNVTRGTNTWLAYPSSLIVEYPYAVVTFPGGNVSIDSLLDQRQIQNMKLEDDVKVSRVSKVFKLQDDRLTSMLSEKPVDDTGADLKLEPSYTKSSSLIYGIKGQFISVLQRKPQPLTWIALFKSCTMGNFDDVLSNLLEELKTLTPGRNRRFLSTLMVLLALKFSKFDQAFDLLSNNLNEIDPRFIIYIMGPLNVDIYGTVLEFSGLSKFAEEIRATHLQSSEMASKEFMELYLSFCKAASSIQSESVTKTIEIYLLEISLDREENIQPSLDGIKYGKKEVIQILLERKRYFYLHRFYESIGNYKESLKCLKELIEGRWEDKDFHNNYKSTDDALEALVKMVLQHCSDNEVILKEYSDWLLSKFPKYGYDIITDERSENIQFNDVKILGVFGKDQPGLKLQYLEYLISTKERKQFIGDAILALLTRIIEIIREHPEIKKQVSGKLQQYHEFSIPKLTIYEFWRIEKSHLNEDFVSIHDSLYDYINMANCGTISVLDQIPVMEECHKNIHETSLADILPLIDLVICYKKGNYEMVVEGFCSLEDFKTGELVASTLQIPTLKGSDQVHSSLTEDESKDISERLLFLIFDIYLKLENSTLIDSFLSKHDLLGDKYSFDVSTMKRMDKFGEILRKIPDDFPLIQLHTFLEQSVADFQGYGEDLILKKSTLRANYLRLKRENKDISENHDI